MRAENVTAVVLAGGLARRMGGVDKGLVLFEGRPLVMAAVERLAPQCARVLVSANRNLARYEALGLETIPDRISGFGGPLAGWEAACAATRTEFLVSAPCDSPRVPRNLVQKLLAALAAHPKARAAAPIVAGKKEPVFALFRRELASQMKEALESGEHRVGLWLTSMGCLWVPFDEADAAAFDNYNTIDELKNAENQ